MREAAAEVGSLQVLSHFGGEYERDADGRVRGLVWHWDGSRTPEHFYAEFVRGMVDIGYTGYVGYELCHPLPRMDGKPAGLDFADRNAGSRPSTCAGCSPRSRQRRSRTRRRRDGRDALLRVEDVFDRLPEGRATLNASGRLGRTGRSR